MTRYEKQDQIYQEILSVKAGLDGCSRGSPQWFELHDRLHILLQAYVAVPQDPSPVNSDGSWKTSHKSSSWENFRKSSRMFLPHLWLIFILVLFSALMIPSLSRDFPCVFPMWLIMFLVSLIWAIFASYFPKE